MHWSGWAVVVLGIILGGWLTFDGGRAVLVGDYVTAQSGPQAGQLGPWSKLVAAVGLDPRSVAVKLAHIILGLLWLGATGCFVARLPWAWGVLVGCAIASLWYLPFGTVIGIVELGLLMLPALRGSGL
jgi:hypothetical protein